MLPKEGKELHPTPLPSGDRAKFNGMIGEALRAELGGTHRAIKTVMRWTGASERSVKHWFAGTHVPSGQHLVAVARHSDVVFARFLVAANRDNHLVGVELSAVKLKLHELLRTLESDRE